MIDPTTGALDLDGIRVDAAMTREAFLASPLAERSNAHEVRTGWTHRKLSPRQLGDRTFFVTLSFEHDRLDGYSLSDADPSFGTSWDDAPPDGETKRRAAHDAWLASVLGPPHEHDAAHLAIRYRFAWGEAWSSYDPRGDCSAIGVRFARKSAP